MPRLTLFALLLCLLARPVLAAPPPDSPFPQAGSPTITLNVDATDAPRNIIHIQEDVPAAPGKTLTLVYPKWIPGEHAPNGPLSELASLRVTAGGQTLPWTRDPVNLYAVSVPVPGGAGAVHAAYDFLCSTEARSALTSPNLMQMPWTNLVLYPQGRTADTVNVHATLRVPDGWKVFSALPVESVTGSVTTFAVAPLVTVLDSPFIAGVHTKVVTLTLPNDPTPAEIDMVGDTDDAIDLPATQIAAYKKLVTEAGALYGGRHYRTYHFLYVLSDYVHGEGLEHHECSQDTDGADTLSDDPKRGSGDLFAHEYTHSWNGKYRRPFDLYQTDYQKPEGDTLLWVYEGQTQFWGYVLAARSGLWTADDYRDTLAFDAADLDNHAGRAWRPLQDTATAASILRSGRVWSSLRRQQDYYQEGVLIWLEADTIIRAQTGGKKSINDFAHVFFGGGNTPPQVKTYTRAQLVSALNSVAPYDWEGLFHQRIDTVQPRAPLNGIVHSGYNLVYNDTPNGIIGFYEKQSGVPFLTASLGIGLNKAGAIVDVSPGMPAWTAGVSPGMTLIAVNGRTYSKSGLTDALKDAEKSTAPITLLVKQADEYRTLTVDYHGGLRYPHLERSSSPDTLSLLLTPLAPPAK